ncbi:PH domain-containing protein [Paenibacillus sp. S-38]|uniref:PH domain-containing protein n=1 Tax=Paenibacillus sp. S-38 TaxID=3416710 RepID=UPI003CF499C3
MNNEKQLHPVFLLFTFYEWIKGLIPIIVILYLRRGQVLEDLYGWGILAALLLILLIGWGVLSWKRFVYMLEDDRLVIRRGVLLKDEKNLYFGRIHSVSMEQPLLQRLLGVVQVRIETPGGGPKSDGLLPAVSLEEAQFLQQWLRQRQHAAQGTGMIGTYGADVAGTALAEKDLGREAGAEGISAPEHSLPQTAPLLKLSSSEVAKAAFSSMNIGMVVAFTGGVYSLLNDFLEDNIYERLFKESAAHLHGGFAILTASSVLLLFAWLLSSVLFILRFGEFTVSRDGEQLVVAHGLLERRKTVFSPRRVQAVIVKEGLLRQLLGYAEIELRVIASCKQEKLVLHPWVRTKDIPALLSEVVPQFTVKPVTARAPRQAFLYYLRFKMLVVTLMCAVAILYFHLPGLWALILYPLTWFWSLHCYKDAGMHLSGGELTLRRRLLSRETCYVLRPQILTVTASGSLAQRKRKLLSLRVNIMGGLGGSSFEVHYLDEGDVQTAWRWFSRSGTGFIQRSR